MKKEKTNEEIKFEDALARLEKIVEDLEKGELPLDQALTAFEEGIRLSRICTNQLNEAERKIEVLLKGKDGQLEIEEFNLENTRE
ncbi:exodeoxyribonuclease VII small subunit [Candidatus Poribacteria bacterium]|nr:exodeoxyribonuclease VII small subunit [Candidatus Poribacteria bacterium]